MNEVTKTIRMPRSILDTWLTALRSGNYKQGTGALYSPIQKGYCCLGVLEACLNEGSVSYCGSLRTVAEITEDFDEMTVGQPIPDNELPSYMEGVVGCYPETEFIGDGIAYLERDYATKTMKTTWRNNEFNPYVQVSLNGVDGLWVDLATLNDDHGFTFEQIADLVEAHTEVIEDA